MSLKNKSQHNQKQNSNSNSNSNELCFAEPPRAFGRNSNNNNSSRHSSTSISFSSSLTSSASSSNSKNSRKRSAIDAQLFNNNNDDNIPPSKIQKLHRKKHHHHHHQKNGNKKELRGLDAYEKIDKLGEGTYGIVYMARDQRTDKYVALKRVRTGLNDKKEGFPVTSIREIKILQCLDHPNIVKLFEVVRSNNIGYVFLVFEYYEHDLSALMDKMRKSFTICEIKCIMLQLLSCIEYAHQHFVIHRDIKLSNILLNNRGHIVLCDWGLARLYSHPLKKHTAKVVTLWYRAPELLFGSQRYHTAVDMWAIGCIFAELLQHSPLLPGKNELHQISLIFKLLGQPNDQIWPNYKSLPKIQSGELNIENILNENDIYKYNQIDTIFAKYKANCLDLIKQFLAYDPAKRINATKAIQHSYFKEMPLPCTEDMMPTFPAKINIDKLKK